MLPIQPTGLWHYLSRNKLIFPKNLRHFFYVSWEDGLWDLLVFFQIPQGSIALIPEFFCMDVVKNMERHGLQCIYYPVDGQLQTDPIVFAKYLKKYKPNVAVIFHAVGIANLLFENSKYWLKELQPKTLLIEDAVHRILDPQSITLLTPKHVVMDSLRKVVPLYGSNFFGDINTFKNMSQTLWWKTFFYQVHVFFWWIFLQICLSLRWNNLAEKAMLAGYGVIGDSHLAGSGFWLFKLLASHVNVFQIKKIKQRQVSLYKKNLQQCWKSSAIFSIKFQKKDMGELRGFPVGLKLPYANFIIENLRKKHLLLRSELDDSPWSRRQKIIYLPLGPHLKMKDIDITCDILISQLGKGILTI